MAKQKAFAAIDPNKDWHKDSRTLFKEEGLSQNFFRTLEGELKQYFIATKNPAAPASEIFPQKTRPELARDYASVYRKRILGVPLGHSQEMYCGNERDKEVSKASAEDQLLIGLHEASHHNMRLERREYNQYLKRILQTLKKDPNAIIPTHPVFGTPDKTLLKEIGATEKFDTPPGDGGGGPPLLDAGHAERAADIVATLFILSNYTSPSKNPIEKERKILDAIQMQTLQRSHNIDGSNHYSTSSINEILSRYERGEIPPNLSMHAAKQMATAMIRENINIYTAELIEGVNAGLAKRYPDLPVSPEAKRLLEESKKASEIYCGENAPQNRKQELRP